MVGSKLGVGEAPAPADTVDQAPNTSRFRRERPGRPWLIGVVAIPILLALIGYGADGRPLAVNGPTGDLPTLTSPTTSVSVAPSLSLALLSISRTGNSVTLIGDVPDDASKAALMKSLKGLLAPGVNVIDQVRIDPLVHALDFAIADQVFAAGAPIPDFNLTVEKDTVTLSGTATSRDQKDAVARAVEGAWPNVNVINRILAKTQITPSAPAPLGAPPAAGPPAPATCNDLQAAINALTRGPLAFGADGVSLTTQDTEILIRVADKLKTCPTARVTVNGYTDNAGAEAINIPLSTQRATAVAEFLIANGVVRDRVTAKGLGSANPIASNDTAEGRAKNRRAELVVG
ncbi:OmpA family protein [Mycobacterium vicinigordonae]|uniref:OmpA family protein n=1 Tax=Mycobacterium vicinigordonae TaxID=1719132 RepID=A0A7D6HZX0_9MYCO|nr:OmpA family protein [Mycobacterium vicinigordonae]QLL06694.1 OmpA family protein [Mycobacterium vicinigordonae]